MLLTAIGELATEQSEGTKTTMEKLSQLLNYCATHPDATVCFTTSNMILAIKSDASYLSVVKARSRAAGYFYLTNALTTPDVPCNQTTAPCMSCTTSCGRSILVLLKPNLVPSSTMEKRLVPCVSPLKKWTIPNPRRQWQTITTQPVLAGIATNTVKQKWSKAIDMRFYRIGNRVRQGQFKIYWRKGQTNRADYFSKHHPASHHQAIRSTYLYSPTNPARNYFDCLSDDVSVPRTTASLAVAPGEGVLLSPGNPENHYAGLKDERKFHGRL